jgi:hypothetical protein
MAGIAGDVDAGWSGVGLSDGRSPVAPGAIATGCVVLVVAALAGGYRVRRAKRDLLSVALGALDVGMFLVGEAHGPLTRRLAGGSDGHIHFDGRRHLARLMAAGAVATLRRLVVADLAATRRCKREFFAGPAEVAGEARQFLMYRM